MRSYLIGADCQIVLEYRNEADGTVGHVVCIAN